MGITTSTTKTGILKTMDEVIGFLEELPLEKMKRFTLNIQSHSDQRDGDYIKAECWYEE